MKVGSNVSQFSIRRARFFDKILELETKKQDTEVKQKFYELTFAHKLKAPKLLNSV